MFIEDTKENLQRRVKEALAYVQEVAVVSSEFAQTLHREATDVEAMLPSLNREGVIQASGFLHGLCYAAAVLLEERKSMTRAK